MAEDTPVDPNSPSGRKMLTQEDIDASPALKARQVMSLRMQDIIKDYSLEEVKSMHIVCTVKIRELENPE